MDKYDAKSSLRALYSPKNTSFDLLVVPELKYLAIDGMGDPDSPSYAAAVQALYSFAYTLKFMSKEQLKKEYVVPPLEALWWADDPSVFVSGERSQWRWTLLLMIPDFVPAAVIDSARSKSRTKGNEKVDSIIVRSLNEGLSFQMLHVGPYADEAEVLHELHTHIMPQNGKTFNGHHHEIYLSDPRKTAAEKLKTILRQPVKDLKS